MKIIRVEGCAGCPRLFSRAVKRSQDNPRPPPSKATPNPDDFHLFGYCLKTTKQLDITWSVNPWYVHPDCPLEEEDDAFKSAVDAANGEK